MINSIKVGQGLAWAAWLPFVASLFMPMETNSLAGPCSWPCTQPFTAYGWKNATFFVLSMIALAPIWPMKIKKNYLEEIASQRKRIQSKRKPFRVIRVSCQGSDVPQ